jgi:hypothetical protein
LSAPEITLASATKKVGDCFRVDFDDGTSIELELTEATRAKTTPTGEDTDSSFSLIFRGPSAPMLAQGIIPLHDEDWGLSHIFLVPLNRDEDSTRYEAAFNLA